MLKTVLAEIVMDGEHQELLGEFQKRMGRNLMLFQSVEIGLKTFLPYIHPEGSKKNSIESLEKYKGAIKSQPLGPVIKAFFESIDCTPNFLENQLEKVRASRNEFVHGGFFELPGITTATKEGLKNGLRYLDEQYKETELAYRTTAQQLLFWMTAARQANAARSDDFELLYKLTKAYVLSYTEWINQIDPSDTDWPNTRIVKLLQLAEIHTDKVKALVQLDRTRMPRIKNLTQLSRAGKFVRSKDQEITPKLYGLKTFKHVLLVSGMFDVYEAPSPDKRSTIVVYKSKIAPNLDPVLTESFMDRCILGA
jgi:hypothetical protein